MRKFSRGFLLVVLVLGLFGVVYGQQSGKGKTTYVLTVVATDVPNPERRTVQCLTSGDYFVDVVIPTSAVVRSSQNGKRLPLNTIGAATKMTCRGNWTDATRTIFRATSVTLVGKVSRGELDRRFAAACDRIAKTNPKARPTPLPIAGTRDVTDQVVVESVTLERRDDLPVQTGTGNAAYTAEGVLRNISGTTYDRVEVQMSVLDRDKKKIADQTATGANIRTGDRWKFQGTPPLYLTYKNAHTIRVEHITATVKR